MTTEEALSWVKDNWVKLPHGTAYSYNKQGPDCVWFAESDISEPYEVDEEKLGMTEGGRLFWAYASGCSCWGGEYEIHEVHNNDVKILELNHENLKAEWETQLKEFVEKHKAVADSSESSKPNK